jgi:transcriptional regulator with XRE-family HTH domain
MSEVEIGERIVQLRTNQDWSQGQMASRIRAAGVNWSQGTLSRVELGERPMRFSEALVAARVLGVTMEALAGVDVTPVSGSLVSGADLMSRVKARRQELGMSADALARTCTEQGFPMKRSTLANLEAGRREDLSVGELLAFAKALKTTPVSLLAAPPCGNCGDAPPRGFRCLQCGVAA